MQEDTGYNRLAILNLVVGTHRDLSPDEVLIVAEKYNNFLLAATWDDPYSGTLVAPSLEDELPA